MVTESPMMRAARVVAAFRDTPSGQMIAAVATADGGSSKLSYGDLRSLVLDLLAAQDRLSRIADWHSLETGPGGMVGLYCTECGSTHPCETRRMADGSHEDLQAVEEGPTDGQ